jgi:lipid II isoglutaminyl synthase (glutamine-hydrolysing)
MNLAILTGKLVALGLRVAGRRGSALPGLVVERVFGVKVLGKLLATVPGGVVMVTGTNGKTSTTKVLAEAFRVNGQRVLTDGTGSNMTRGLLSLVIKKSKLSGKLPYDIAVLEVDEAYSAVISKLIAPRALLVLNIHRDQMDRYGEIDKTTAMIAETAAVTKELVMLSGIDRQMPEIAKAVKHANVEYFSCSEELLSEFPDDEELYETISSHTSFGVQADYVLVDSVDDACVVSLNSKRISLMPNVSGAYNHLNSVAALGVFCELISPTDEELGVVVKAVEHLEPAFGRGETIKVGESEVTILLVKNPGGFNQAFKLATDKFDFVDVLINDGYADGRDVSWLWDVDFGQLKSTGVEVNVGGDRSYDMATRLKHEGIEAGVYSGLQKVVDACSLKPGKRLIFATYTAMLEVRSLLANVSELEKVL